MSPTKTSILNAARGVFRIPAFEQALLRLTTGATYPGPLAKLPPNSYQYPKGSIRRVTRHGLTFDLDISDIVDWFIYFGFRQQSLETLYRHARTGDTVFDVGGNNGHVALNLARRVGSEGRVVSFEPDPATFARLHANVELNKPSNLQIENCGLGSASGSFTWVRPDAGNAGMNRLAVADEMPADGVRVAIRTLDDYVRARGLTRLDLIKIDVEGYERGVIEGATETLRALAPTLFVELGEEQQRKFGGSAAELVALIESMDYDVTHSETGAVIKATSDFTTPTSPAYCADGHMFDVLCQRRSRS